MLVLVGARQGDVAVKLTLVTHPMTPEHILKVRVGDLISAQVDWYTSAASSGSALNM